MAAWREEWGAAFHLRAFLRDQLVEGDAVADFLATALPDHDLTAPALEDANESPTLEEIALLMRFFATLKRERVPIERLHGSLGRKISRHLAAVRRGPGTKIACHRALAEEAFASCIEDARTLDAEFFGGSAFEDALVAEREAAIESAQSYDAADHTDAEGLKFVDATARFVADLIRNDADAFRLLLRNPERLRRPAPDPAPPSPPPGLSQRLKRRFFGSSDP